MIPMTVTTWAAATLTVFLGAIPAAAEDLKRTTASAPEALTPGEHTILVKFKYSGEGQGKPADLELLVDGKSVATDRIEKTIPIRVSLDETLDIGEDTGTPVSEDYKTPFKFTGELEKVTVELK